MKKDFISIDIKRECLRLSSLGKTHREIYNDYFKKQFDSPQTFASFEVSIRRWKRTPMADTFTLASGTYDGFTAHDATVQVSSNGQIVQAWIKQKQDNFDPEDFVNAIKEHVEPCKVERSNEVSSDDMLEIPLFDMHWGIAYLDHYQKTLDEILSVINERRWDKIEIPFGQDFFHNDSVIKGETTKGTVIQKVDTYKAVKEGKQFMYSIIDAAIANSNATFVRYSPGNHDKSISWMFMQVLLERYGPAVVDDSVTLRKVMTFGQSVVMVTHGEAKRDTPDNLAHIFPIKFPEEFGISKIREVHAGHLHSEASKDVFGVMVRRLSSASKEDDWSDKESYIGAIKRFMLFRWSPTKLKSIYYI